MTDASGTPVTARGGELGFDVNQPVDSAAAAAMYAHGYRFAVRYVRRALRRSSDLSDMEMGRLLAAGLAVMAVQHVESETSWMPDAIKGHDYGAAAAAAVLELSLHGTVVWCDLEGVAIGTSAEDVLAYCNAWYDEVAAAGAIPGLYVGFHCGLTPDQLYEELKFKHYWAAYNLDADQEPVTRGVQMRQHEVRAKDIPAGVTLAIDTDVIRADALGGLPILLAPPGWPAPVNPFQ